MISFQKRKFGSIRRYPIVGGRRLSNYWWSLVIFLGGCGFLLTGISSYFNINLWNPFGLQHILPPLFTSIYEKTITPITSIIAKLPLQGNGGPGGKELHNASFPKGDKLTFLENFVTLFGNLIQKINQLTTEAEFYPNIKPLNSNIETNLPFFPQGLVLCFYGFLGLSFSFHLWFTLYWKIGGGFNEFNGKERYVRLFRWGRPGKNRRIDLKYTDELIEAIKVELVPRPALFLRVKGEKNIPLTRIGEFIPLEELEAQAAELTSFMQIPLEMEN